MSATCPIEPGISGTISMTQESENQRRTDTASLAGPSGTQIQERESIDRYATRQLRSMESGEIAGGNTNPHAFEAEELLTVVAQIVARLLSVEIDESTVDGLNAA